MEANQSIGCTVEECKYHATSKDYCTLDKIQVGKCNCGETTRNEETDCESFQAK